MNSGAGRSMRTPNCVSCFGLPEECAQSKHGRKSPPEWRGQSLTKRGENEKVGGLLLYNILCPNACVGHAGRKFSLSM